MPELLQSVDGIQFPVSARARVSQCSTLVRASSSFWTSVHFRGLTIGRSDGPASPRRPVDRGGDNDQSSPTQRLALAKVM
jgi:hypothetical protein